MKMVEWDVYVDEIYLGTVFAVDESSARLAAFSKYGDALDADVSVKRR
jgi:hypothetical protein